MVIFSSLIPDSKIIKASEGFTSVVIVGCAGCANASIAYEKYQPVYKISTDMTTGKTKILPFAIMQQADHLKKQLEEKGLNITIEIIYPLCYVTDERELSRLMLNPSWADLGFNERCVNAEAFITLCCGGGVFGLKQRFGEDIKMIPGMREAGTAQLFLALDDTKEFVLIDRDRSTVIQRK